MDLFVSNAWAQGAGAPAGQGGLMGLLPLVLLFVVFYWFLIRPQMKARKEHSRMVAALAKGDEAVTSGGLFGRITEVGETFVEFEIAKGVEVRVQKHAIAAVMPKGTSKTL